MPEAALQNDATRYDPLAGLTGAGNGGGGEVIPFPPRRGGDSVRSAVAQEWLNAGYSPVVVQGIMRRIDVESGFDPLNTTGDGGTSLGLYQHHADRAQKLAQYLQTNGASANDPVGVARLSTRFAISELNGGDSIAAAHRNELMQAKDANTAYGIFTSSFERPAGSPGSEETNLRSMAFGSFSPAAQNIIDQTLATLRAQQPAIDAAIRDAKDMHQLSRAMTQQWMAESQKPPQNAREAWSQWAGVAGALALFGGMFGRRSMTAAVNAAGEMLQAANTADQRAYDTSYRRWSDHLDRGLKAIEMINGEAKDIVNDSKLSYDQQVAQLKVLSDAYGIAQNFDHAAVQKQLDNLNIAIKQKEVLDAQNADAQIRGYIKEKTDEYKAQNNGAAPPASKLLEWRGEAERLGKGTIAKAGPEHQIEVVGPDGRVVQRGAAYRSADNQYYWIGTNEPVSVPQGGKVNLRSTQQPRSAPGMYIQKFMEETPTATADEISHANALFRADATFASGPEGRNVTALNTLADHLPLFEKYARALQTGNLQVINAALQRLQEETGHPEISNFNLARDFIADEAVRVMVSGGSGGALADREAMKQDLLARMSQAQFGGAADVIKDFTHGKLAALRQQYSRSDPKKEDYFNTRILTPDARRLFDTQDSAAPTGAGLPDAARAQLRKGENVTFGNGQVWTLDENGQPKQVR